MEGKREKNHKRFFVAFVPVSEGFSEMRRGGGAWTHVSNRSAAFVICVIRV